MKTTGFDLAVAALKEEYQTSFFSSAHGDREKREIAYQQARALDDLLITLNTFVSIADANTQSQEDEADEYNE